MKSDSPHPRAYRQTARAQSASATGERILDAFIARLREGWFDEIRLDDVASDAEVTVQTVIRRFGGKDGLLDACDRKLSAEIVEGRRLPAGNVSAAIDAIIDEYELHGRFVLQLLSQEERYAAIRAMTDNGRAVHRQWVGKVFEAWLLQFDGSARTAAHDRLVIALDLYVWKLVRVDMQRPVSSLRETMVMLCAVALGTTPETLLNSPLPEKINA